jgi:hypothetical protein
MTVGSQRILTKAPHIGSLKHPNMDVSSQLAIAIYVVTDQSI